MSTHHAQTALRYIDQATGSELDARVVQAMATSALVHAELETAEQIERIGNMLEIGKVQLEAMRDMFREAAQQVSTEVAPFLTQLAKKFGL